MIISHKHKFIFMHSRKTAGSTLATILNRHLGPDDIQIGAWVDTIDSGGKYNKNIILKSARYPIKVLFSSIKYSFNHKSIRLSPIAINSSTKLYYRSISNDQLTTHATAEAVKSHFPDIWNEYFKFAFVRNPFSHAVSDYYWRLHLCGEPSISFKEFIYRLYDSNRPDPENIRPPIISNWNIYTINNKVEMDFIGYFEKLDEEIRKIESIIGIDLVKNINNSKGSIRSKSKSIEDHYDQELIEKVSTIYKKEIDHFGYSAFSGLPSKTK